MTCKPLFLSQYTNMSNPDCCLTTGGPCYEADTRPKYKQRIRGQYSVRAYMTKREGYVDGIGRKGKQTSLMTYCWIDYCPSCQIFCENTFLPYRQGILRWEVSTHSGGYSGEMDLRPGETKFDAIERVRRVHPHATIAASDNISFYQRSILPKISLSLDDITGL